MLCPHGTDRLAGQKAREMAMAVRNCTIGHNLARTLGARCHSSHKDSELFFPWVEPCASRGGRKRPEITKRVARWVRLHGHSLFYAAAARSVISSSCNSLWQNRLHHDTEDDDIAHLTRARQIVIFRLRTGHCRLLAPPPLDKKNIVHRSCPTLKDKDLLHRPCPCSWPTSIG